MSSQSATHPLSAPPPSDALPSSSPPQPSASPPPAQAQHQHQQRTTDTEMTATSTAVSHPAQNATTTLAASQSTKTLGPKSSYYFGPPGKDRAFGSPPAGVIGRDKPREIVRIERDYTTGELPQFHPAFPLELEDRLSPTVFSELINDINVLLISAHSSGWTWLDNTLAILTLYLSPWILGTQHGRKMAELDRLIDEANRTTLNPQGLNMLPPRKNGFLFIELEYY